MLFSYLLAQKFHTWFKTSRIQHVRNVVENGQRVTYDDTAISTSMQEYPLSGRPFYLTVVAAKKEVKT